MNVLNSIYKQRNAIRIKISRYIELVKEILFRASDDNEKKTLHFNLFTQVSGLQYCIY